MGFRLVIGFIEHLQNVITNNYDCLTELHTPKITVTTAHIKSSQVCTSRWLVAAFNGGHSPYSVFPNCPRPQLPASQFSQKQLSTDSINHSKSKLLYDWWFTGNQFVLSPSPLGLTIRDFFQMNPLDHSPYIKSSVTRRLVYLLCIRLAFY
jgi:hypothetical protein